MSTLCGLRSKSKYRTNSQETKSKQPADEYELHRANESESREKGSPKGKQLRPVSRRRKNAGFEGAREEDQLSVILEILEGESRRNTPNWNQDPRRKKTLLDSDQVPRLEQRTQFHDEDYSRDDQSIIMSSPKAKSSPGTPKPIEDPPTDVSCSRTQRSGGGVVPYRARPDRKLS